MSVLQLTICDLLRSIFFEKPRALPKPGPSVVGEAFPLEYDSFEERLKRAARATENYFFRDEGVPTHCPVDSKAAHQARDEFVRDYYRGLLASPETRSSLQRFVSTVLPSAREREAREEERILSRPNLAIPSNTGFILVDQ
jgi:hypothetical protein